MRLFHAPDFGKFLGSDGFEFGAFATGFPHCGGGGDELGKVFVGGDHEGVVFAFVVGGLGESSDEVVGFVAIDFEEGDGEGFAEFLAGGDGGAEFVRHLVAVGLVFRIFFVARSGGRGVPGDGEVGGFLVLDDGEKGIGEAEEGGGIHALGVHDGIADEGKVGAVDEGHAIEEKEAVGLGCFGHGGRIGEGEPSMKTEFCGKGNFLLFRVADGEIFGKYCEERTFCGVL